MATNAVKAWALLTKSGKLHQSLDGYNLIGTKKAVKSSLAENESAVPCTITYPAPPQRKRRKR